jgi:exopolyphosphatase/guanosine-5'-triphosphate,3'-diphosphate pyrophosphatase
MRRAVEDHLRDVGWLAGAGVSDLISIGGTARAVAKLHRMAFGTDKTQDYAYPAADMDRLLEMLTEKDSYYEAITKILPERVFTITPGFIALYVIAKSAGVSRVVVSRYGVREGYLIEKVLEKKEP